MVKPYSNDLREHAIAALAGGQPASVVGERFCMGKTSVTKCHQRYRKTGSMAPGKMGGHCKHMLDPHRDFIIQAIKQPPHLTLHDLKDSVGERGFWSSHNAVWYFLNRRRPQLQKKRGSHLN